MPTSDVRRPTSPGTRAAALSVLTARGWSEGRGLALRPSVRSDEIILSPVIGDVDVMPGTGTAERCPEDRAAWFAAADRLWLDLTAAGWTSCGATSAGMIFRRPAAVPEAAARP